MTCHAHISAGVADRMQLSAMAVHMDSQGRASGPAARTATRRNAGDLSAMIACRCKRMTFRSNEARKRFLSVHLTLATCSAGDT